MSKTIVVVNLDTNERHEIFTRKSKEQSMQGEVIDYIKSLGGNVFIQGTYHPCASNSARVGGNLWWISSKGRFQYEVK